MSRSWQLFNLLVSFSFLCADYGDTAMSQRLQRLSCARADSDVPCNALWNVGPVSVLHMPPRPGRTKSVLTTISAFQPNIDLIFRLPWGASFLTILKFLFSWINLFSFGYQLAKSVSRTDGQYCWVVARDKRTDLIFFWSKCFLLFSSKSMAIVWAKGEKDIPFNRLQQTIMCLDHVVSYNDELLHSSDPTDDTRVW